MMFATVTGILMALFLDNVGGAWDNAKKYIELGNFGGKGVTSGRKDKGVKNAKRMA